MSKNIENMNWLSLAEVKQRRKIIASHYDEYVEYIDNYRQYKEAKDNNRRIREDLKKIDIIIKEMEEVQEELNKRNIDGALLRYAKGRLQIIHNGRTLYRNVKF